jgi:hypothetical protein
MMQRYCITQCITSEMQIALIQRHEGVEHPGRSRAKPTHFYMMLLLCPSCRLKTMYYNRKRDLISAGKWFDDPDKPYARRHKTQLQVWPEALVSY